MSSRYPPDIFDGVERPPLVVTSDTTLDGLHAGSVHVESGRLLLTGTLQGSLTLHSGSTATISGRQQGSVHVAAGASVPVTGAIEGSMQVSPGAAIVVERGGKLAGSLHNDGEVMVRGVFGGQRSGSGSFVLDGGSVKQPQVRDGVYFYDWSADDHS
jgi:hypothetical protein